MNPDLLAWIKANRPDLYRQIEAIRADRGEVRIVESFKLEKFDGEYVPGKVPVEVIEGGDNRPTVCTKADGTIEILRGVNP